MCNATVYLDNIRPMNGVFLIQFLRSAWCPPGPPRGGAGGGGGGGGNLPRAPTNEGPPKRRSEAGI